MENNRSLIKKKKKKKKKKEIEPTRIFRERAAGEVATKERRTIITVHRCKTWNFRWSKLQASSAGIETRSGCLVRRTREFRVIVTNYVDDGFEFFRGRSRCLEITSNSVDVGPPIGERRSPYGSKHVQAGEDRSVIVRHFSKPDEIGRNCT